MDGGKCNGLAVGGEMRIQTISRLARLLCFAVISCLQCACSSMGPHPIGSFFDALQVGNGPNNNTPPSFGTTEVFKGAVWDKGYHIIESAGGTYYIQLIGSSQWDRLPASDALERVYQDRTGKQSVEAYRAPIHGCENRYFVVVGSISNIYTSMFGCDQPLQFEPSKDGDFFATQPPAVEGLEPLAYEIGPNGVSPAESVSMFPNHPQYVKYVANDYRRPASTTTHKSSSEGNIFGTVKPGSVSNRQTASASSTGVTPVSHTLPAPAPANLPKQVPNQAVQTTNPQVDLGGSPPP